MEEKLILNLADLATKSESRQCLLKLQDNERKAKEQSQEATSVRKLAAIVSELLHPDHKLGFKGFLIEGRVLECAQKLRAQWKTVGLELQDQELKYAWEMVRHEHEEVGYWVKQEYHSVFGKNGLWWKARLLDDADISEEQLNLSVVGDSDDYVKILDSEESDNEVALFEKTRIGLLVLSSTWSEMIQSKIKRNNKRKLSAP